MTNALLNLDDPRRGATSASNAQADALCPGRHLAQAGLPEQTSEYAESGRKIHAALAVKAIGDRDGNRSLRDQLSLTERECYDECLTLQTKLVSQFFGTDIAGFREFREQRYWARINLQPDQYPTLTKRVLEHSGQADVVFRAGTRALVLDFKTQQGDVAESSRNLQLRDLACLVRGHFVPTDKVGVAIIQPYVSHNPELCIYSKEDLERATKEMFDRVVLSNDPASNRKAGEVQCKYCRAKRDCVQYQQWAGQITPPAMLSLLSVPMNAWTPEQKALAAGALGPCQKFLDELKDMLKSILEQDPNAIPGWTLAPGKMRETITDPQKVFERFCTLGGKAEQFMVCVNVAKGKLRSALNIITGAKGAKLDAAMQSVTDGCVEQSRTAPSLVRADAPKEIEA